MGCLFDALKIASTDWVRTTILYSTLFEFGVTIKAALAKGASEPGLLDKWQAHSWAEIAGANPSCGPEDIQQAIGSPAS